MTSDAQKNDCTTPEESKPPTGRINYFQGYFNVSLGHKHTLLRIQREVYSRPQKNAQTY